MMMNYQWRDYEPCGMTFVEAWLDEQAVAATGLDEGFRSFYEYWVKEEVFVPGRISGARSCLIKTFLWRLRLFADGSGRY